MTTVTPPILFLDDPLPLDGEEALHEYGGKGLSLRRLSAAGCRVPGGMTIPASVCRAFHQSGRQLPSPIWDEIVAGVVSLEKKTGRSFAATTSFELATEGESLRLAVRSGAAVSMPGLLETHLNVMPDTPTSRVTEADRWQPLKTAIEGVLASWENAAARAYRESQGINHDLGTAVTVQEMIDARWAGVLFTRSPDDLSGGTIIIEAVAGSGDALVSGRVTPHRWVVSRDSLEVIETDTAIEGDVVETAADFDGLLLQLRDLCETSLRLEREFGYPLDIEWAVDRKGFVFLQARAIGDCGPVDSSEVCESSEAYCAKEIARLKQLAATGTGLFVRHNLDETLPSPTPLTWCVWQSMMSGNGGLGTLYRRLGYEPAGSVAANGFLTLIGGRIYANADRAVDLFGEHHPFVYDPVELHRDPSSIDRGPTKFDPARTDPFLLIKLPVIAWRSHRRHRLVRDLMQTAAARFEETIVPAYVARVGELRNVDLNGLDDAALLQTFSDRRRWVMDEFAPESLLPGTLGGMAFDRLRKSMTDVLGPYQVESIIDDLTPAGDITLQQRQRQLLASEAGMETFIEEFGHRGIGELELGNPRWRESPILVQEMMTVSPESLSSEESPPFGDQRSPAELQEQALDRLREVFVDAGARCACSSSEEWLADCWRLLPYRDRGRHLLMMGYELLRLVTEELARRTELGELLYFLNLDELAKVTAGHDLQDTIARRRAEWDIAKQMTWPLVIDASNPTTLSAELTERETTAVGIDGTTLDGVAFDAVALVGGVGEGVVWRVDDFSGCRVPEGPTVLVSRTLDPSVGPLLPQMAAVIVEQGGSLSHGAILARQFGVPTVRLVDATRHLQAGDRVQVDGSNGRITVIEREAR